MSGGPLMSRGPLISGADPGAEWKGPEGPALFGPFLSPKGPARISG